VVGGEWGVRDKWAFRERASESQTEPREAGLGEKQRQIHAEVVPVVT